MKPSPAKNVLPSMSTSTYVYDRDNKMDFVCLILSVSAEEGFEAGYISACPFNSVNFGKFLQEIKARNE